MFAVAAFLALLGLFFVRTAPNAILTPAEHDSVQSARYLAQTGRLGTNVIRPLLTDRLPANRDGTLPDMAHPPLYSVLAAGAMRAFHQTAPTQGGREAALVSVFAFAFSVFACAWLARQLFGPGVGLLASAFYVFASPFGLHFVVSPSPLTLGTLLLTLLFVTLHKLDGVPLAGDSPVRSPLWMAGLAGGVYGLLFLTVYSTLILLPLFLAYLWRVGGREKWSLLVAFASVWLLVCGPYMVRNVRLTRSPIYNSRLFEIMMHISSASGASDGDGLYHEADLPQTLTQFAARGGAAQIVSKAASNIAGLVRDSPVVLGVFVLPLFLGAGLSRFPDARANRLRNLGYAAVVLHLVGTSLFLPHNETAALLRLYAPLASGLGAAFLLAVLRARNLPAFHARAALGAWATLACFGGVWEMITGNNAASAPRQTPPPGVLYALNYQSPEMAFLRQKRNAVLLSNEPECAADLLGFPVVLLPSDSRSVVDVQKRMGKWVGGIILTSILDRPQAEITPSALAPWGQLYRQIVQLRNITSGLDPKTRRSVVQQKEIFYPTALSAAMRSFPRPVPQMEAGGETSLVFWNQKAFDAGTLAGGEQEP